MQIFTSHLKKVFDIRESYNYAIGFIKENESNSLENRRSIDLSIFQLTLS